jgi:hypothetical protein
MRIAVPLVIEMNDEQLANYAKFNGLGEKPRAKDVVAEVRSYVLTCIQDAGDFTGGAADVSINLNFTA